jgi:predicted XRE-type DNA-binding protein
MAMSNEHRPHRFVGGGSEENIAKAVLVHHIATIIRNQGLEQREAVDILDAPPSEVSSIVNDELSGEFSFDRLLRYLTALGQEIEIVVRRHVQGPAQLHVTLC